MARAAERMNARMWFDGGLQRTGARQRLSRCAFNACLQRSNSWGEKMCVYIYIYINHLLLDMRGCSSNCRFCSTRPSARPSSKNQLKIMTNHEQSISERSFKKVKNILKATTPNKNHLGVAGPARAPGGPLGPQWALCFDFINWNE